jgi:heme/copper-type cytochrome/quinol oxidase subunit 2
MKMEKFDLRILISLLTSTFLLSFFTHPSNAVVGNGSVDQVFILFQIAYLVVGFFTGLYLLVMLWFLIRYRNSSNRESTVWSLKKQNKYILYWVLLVCALVATETLVEAPVTDFVTAKPEDRPVDGVINVRAHQFAFELNGSQSITIQRDKVYMVNVTSSDVIHSFYLFEFGYKIDAVPGRFNIFYLHITDISNQPADGYLVICSEYCGSSHYIMAQDAANGGGAARILVV